MRGKGSSTVPSSSYEPGLQAGDIGEVLDARSPWQLLYRLSRIVFLGLVLYLGWILVVVQPDLARRLMLSPTPRFQERFALHREPVEEVLQAAVAAPGFGLHALFVAEWDGAGSLQVLAFEHAHVEELHAHVGAVIALLHAPHDGIEAQAAAPRNNDNPPLLLVAAPRNKPRPPHSSSAAPVTH